MVTKEKLTIVVNATVGQSLTAFCIGCHFSNCLVKKSVPELILPQKVAHISSRKVGDCDGSYLSGPT